MRARTTLILCVAGAVALGAGVYLGSNQSAGVTQTIAMGRLAFPHLASRLRNAARIELVHGGTTLAIEKKGDRWVSANNGGYPVQADKLHGLLAGLTELRLMEQRTADPALLGRLGLDDPQKKGSTAVLLRVLDAGGKPIAALVLGHRRVNTQGDLPEQVYVRFPDNNQSWLAEGRVDTETDPANWLNREIADIESKSVASVTVTRGEQQISLARQNGQIVLTAPADHGKLDQGRLDDVFRAYEALTFTDVKPVAEMPGERIGRSVFTTSDGLKIEAVLNKSGNDVWARFSASGDGAAKAQAEKMNARTQGWAYDLMAWKEQALAPTLKQLEQDQPDQKSSSTPAASPATSGH
jgi:hypothetical protein